MIGWIIAILGVLGSLIAVRSREAGVRAQQARDAKVVSNAKDGAMANAEVVARLNDAAVVRELQRRFSRPEG